MKNNSNEKEFGSISRMMDQGFKLKFTHKSTLLSDPNGLKLKEIHGLITVKEFIKLLAVAENQVNPRIAKENKVTKAINETLNEFPKTFRYKNRGLLIGTLHFDENFDRNRAEISFENADLEGIMDGGHSTLALAQLISEKTIGVKFKTWAECKSIWKNHYDEIMDNFNEEDFKDVSIRVEIITPDGDDDSDYYDWMASICEGRNNSVQLKETAKANQKGIYDTLKQQLPDLDISWKTGDGGKFKSEDIIALSTIPFIFLIENKELPTDYSLNKISLYSAKGKCTDFFNDVISDERISEVDEFAKYVIINNQVETSLKLANDIVKFYDKLYVEFPNLYHTTLPGKFGGIKSVKKKSISAPFGTTSKISDYDYSAGFITPILTGITKLMTINPITKSVTWIVNPLDINLEDLDLKTYIKSMKSAGNLDPVKVGKDSLCYDLGERIFEDYLRKNNIQVYIPSDQTETTSETEGNKIVDLIIN